MKLTEAMKSYFEKIKEVEASADKAARLIAGECIFFDKDDVLDYGKPFGNARYPYSRDGLTVWAHSSGNISVEESTLDIFPNTTEGGEPRIAFFAGERCEGGFFPISLTGVAKQLFEKGVKRYTVFTPYATYYLTEAAELRSAVRVYLDRQKRMRFDICLENTGEGEVSTYISSYFNPKLKVSISEAEAKWYKRIAAVENGFTVSVTEHVNRNVCFERYGAIARSSVTGALATTTSHADYCGGYNNQLLSAEALRCGAFAVAKPHTTFNESAVAADMLTLTLGRGECATLSYTVAVGTDPCEVFARATELREVAESDAILEEIEKNPTEIYKEIPNTSFDGLMGVSGDKVNYFINNVFKQTEFCARAKNYAGPYIGIRDIFQQLEAALMWIPEYSREKIIEALNFIGDDGRAPRQYSYPHGADVAPDMDIRPFIDQGNWIISTVYEYLSFTDDFSILDEICGYYKIGKSSVDFSDRRDSVLCHLIAITDYLLSHVDPDTDCLHAMYGDWNDALDGLGRSKKSDDEYGNGVSVMATLHLYRNLYEITDILARCGKYPELEEKYTAERARIAGGIIRCAVEHGADGARKILHGWGENISYKIGSFSDNDGESRDSLTANAFFILTDAIELDESLKGDIMAALERLDSKYGYKTFEPYFAKTNKDVGRIVKLPKGTAENGATYIHATLFAIWALFRVGECRAAWEQIYKILPITHDSISTTPFVMPNSYIHNLDEALDGESMSDWFTGSGCVLLKALVRSVFGIEPDLDGITVAPAAYIPTDACSITVRVKGVKLTVVYKNCGTGKRTFTVNGEAVESVYDARMGTEKIRLTPDCDCTVTVID
ncbi:MAG: hypothetical protein IJ515_04930 [Clostridia bacterium]|nr:hypothetical protein [Clostridia bacterium]